MIFMNKKDLKLKIEFKGSAEISGWDGKRRVLDNVKVLLNCPPLEIRSGDDSSKIIGDALIHTLAIHLRNRQTELLTAQDEIQKMKENQDELFAPILEAVDI